MENKTSPQDRLLIFGKWQAEEYNKKRELAKSPQASQIRAACALLNWDDGELARASGLIINFVRKVQAGAVQPSAKTMSALRNAFSDAGVILISQGKGIDEGLGVRLRKIESNSK